MAYIVIDLEWNTANWKTRRKLKDKLPFSAEIMEIGAVLLDSDFTIQSAFSTDVKTKYFTFLDKHVEEVTGRDEESLRQGLPFPQALQAFYSWLEENEVQDYIFCTWSKADIDPWLSNMAHYRLAHKVKTKVLDVQRLFGHHIENLKEQKSVCFALEYFNIPADRDFHKAINDAYYTAEILQCLVSDLKSRAKLPQDKAECYKVMKSLSIDPTLTTRAKIKLPAFKNIKAAKRSIKKMTWTCPACGKELAGHALWKTRKETYFYRKLHCPEHGIVNVEVSLYFNSKEKPPAWQGQAKVQLKMPL